MNDFHDILVECDLRDLGYIGSPFTWCNNREGNHRILERLDPFLANSLWFELFPLSLVCNGQVAYSDHCLIWLNTMGISRKDLVLEFSTLRLCGSRKRSALTLLRMYGL